MDAKEIIGHSVMEYVIMTVLVVHVVTPTQAFYQKP